MVATKEATREAQERLVVLMDWIKDTARQPLPGRIGSAAYFLQDFLQAAENRLPTRAAVEHGRHGY